MIYRYSSRKHPILGFQYGVFSVLILRISAVFFGIDTPHG